MMFNKDIPLLEENEETKLLEAEHADPGQISSSNGTYCSLEAFAFTASGILLLLLGVAYLYTTKCKNMVDQFSSGKELHNVVAHETSSDTFVYAMTYDPGFCYKSKNLSGLAASGQTKNGRRSLPFMVFGLRYE
jgi:ribonuclease I